MKINVISLILRNKLSPRWRQTYVALGPILITISLGMAEGYSAILLPQLKREGTIQLDSDKESWIASIAALPMPFACIMGGYLIEVIGRKTIHMICCILCIIGWLILYFAEDYASILIGRCITGSCVGLLGPPTGVYMAETSEPTFRGVLLGSISFAIAFGVAVSHLLGTFVSWKLVAMACCLFPIISFLTMIFAPESPTFLAKKGKSASAMDSFYWCRGNGVEAQLELKILLERQGILCQQKSLSWKHYFVPEFIKPLILMLVFFFTAQWCGSNAITFYNVSILQQTLNGSLNEYMCMLLMDFIRLVSSILACILLKIMGRRTLALISCSGTLTSLLVLSSSMYLRKYYPYMLPNSHILVLVSFLTYMAFMTIGLVPVPWTMTGEVFPLASRGMGSGISAMVNYGFIFSVVKTTPWLFNNLGSEGAFLLYATMCLVGFVILALFLPETKDKALHEIEDKFKGVK